MKHAAQAALLDTRCIINQFAQDLRQILKPIFIAVNYLRSLMEGVINYRFAFTGTLVGVA